MITKDFRDWPTAKEWVLEMSRRMAMHGRPSKLLHLPEAEGTGVDEALALLAEIATAEEILAVIASKRPWLKGARRPPGAAGAARPPPRAAGAAGAAAGAGRPSPTTKDGRLFCSNCSEIGHTKETCKQPKVEFSKRKCFTCLKTGHSSNQCPSGKPSVRIL